MKKITLFILLFVAYLANGQNIRLSGLVTSAKDGNPVAFANIVAVG